MLEESIHGIIKPKNARSPLKEVLGFKVCSNVSTAHCFPWGLTTTKGALDTKDHHCESKDSKRTSSKLSFQTWVHS